MTNAANKSRSTVRGWHPSKMTAAGAVDMRRLAGEIVKQLVELEDRMKWALEAQKRTQGGKNSNAVYAMYEPRRGVAKFLEYLALGEPMPLPPAPGV